MSSLSITEFFPPCCSFLEELCIEANKILDECEKERAKFFSAVVLYKIKVDSIKKVKEDKSINLNIDTNLKEERTKIAVALNSGVYFNYPFETCPPEVIDSLFSFSLSFESRDKEDSLNNLKSLNDLLVQFKSLNKAKELEVNYNILIHSEGLKNHLIISLKVDNKYKDLIKKVKIVFPIEKYFLSILGKIILTYGIKLNECDKIDNEKLIQLLESPHLSFDLRVKNYEIVNELYATYLKLLKMIEKAEGNIESSTENDESDWNITHFILLFQAFTSLSFDFKMIPSLDILRKIFDSDFEEDLMNIIKKKAVIAPFINSFNIKEEKCEINFLIPILMIRLNVSLSYPGFKNL